MSERTAYGVLGALVAILAVAALLFDLPSEAGHEFWSDSSTYYSMTWSLAEDFDLRYEARDLLRVERRYGGRPRGCS